MNFNIIYLHGFASSPASQKAIYFKNKFKNKANIRFTIPDLNIPSFTYLSVKDEINLIHSLIRTDEKNIIIAASFGAYLSLLLVDKYDLNIDLLILMAPAINMASRTIENMDKNILKQWENSHFIKIDHFSYKKKIDLHYKFIEELLSYEKLRYQFNTKCIVFHGKNDVNVPYTITREYLEAMNNCEIHYSDSDHRLIDQLEYIWNHIENEIIKLENEI